jgi:hypothetical protein
MERPGSKCGRGRWCAIGVAVKRVDVNVVTMQATGGGERGAGDGERPVSMLDIQVILHHGVVSRMGQDDG